MFAKGLQREEAWHWKLFLGALQDSDVEVMGSILMTLKPLDEAMDTLIRACGVECTPDERMYWLDQIWSQMMYFTFAKPVVLLEYELEDYDQGFIATTGWRIARTAILSLGIPLRTVKQIETYQRAPCPADGRSKEQQSDDTGAS